MRIVYEDIENMATDVIVNAANAKGFMGGFVGRFVKLKGVAESIHYKTKGIVEREAKQIASKTHHQPGDVFITSAHDLNAALIFHAVTMKKPRRKSSIGVVETCLENVLETARKYKVSSISLPLLGTGTGKVPKEQVMALYERYFSKVTDLDVYVVLPKGKSRR